MKKTTITLDRQHLYHIYDASKREYLRLVAKDPKETAGTLREMMNEKYEIVKAIDEQEPIIGQMWMAINHAKQSGNSVEESNLIKRLVNWYCGND